jgi:hypothetical protein
MYLYRINNEDTNPLFLTAATCSVVPRSGEIIRLNLSSKTVDADYLFETLANEYIMLNTEYIEDDKEPWCIESEDVIVYVQPSNDEARNYIQRLTIKNHRSIRSISVLARIRKKAVSKSQ